MENLLELAINATRENVVKRSRPENINDAMLRVLYTEKKGPMKRTNLIAKISLDRMVHDHGEAEVTKWAEEKAAGKSTTFDDKMKEYNKTVKNGIDTGVSDSNNNSAFSYNPKYKEYELVKEGDTINIVKRQSKAQEAKADKKKK